MLFVKTNLSISLIINSAFVITGYKADQFKYLSTKYPVSIVYNPDYVYEQYAQHLKCSRRTIARMIKRLQGNDIIRRVGADKNGHWEVLSSQDVPLNVPLNVPQDGSINVADVVKDVAKDVAENSKKQ